MSSSNKILKNDQFIITEISNDEAYLGDGSERNGNGFIEYDQIAGDVVIPSKILNHKIIGIKYLAIRGCFYITSIKLPNTIKHLEDTAFTWCTSLKTVIFPSSIETIEGYNDYFTNATEIYFEPNSQIKSIGDSFLRHCYEVTEFIFPKTIETIGSKIFDKCTKLKKCSFCGESDFSSVVDAFPSAQSTLLIMVTKEYKGSTFGGWYVVPVPLQMCQILSFGCYQTIQCKIYNKIVFYLISIIIC